MDIESSRIYIDDLYSEEYNKVLKAIVCLKHSIIGSNRQKEVVIAQGIVPRLLQLLGNSFSNSCNEVQLESAVILGSLAKGSNQYVLAMVDLGIIPNIINLLISLPIEKLKHARNHSILLSTINACMRCLRYLLHHPAASTCNIPCYIKFINRLLVISFTTVTCQICVGEILASICKTREQQNMMLKYGLVNVLTMFLESHLIEVQLSALKCLCCLCYKNSKVATLIVSSITSFSLNFIPVVKNLENFTARNKNIFIQLEAARCITYIHRAMALKASNNIIVFKVLPCLIRLCHKDKCIKERVAAAETLAYLIEVDTNLQRLASISNYLVPTLADFFKTNSQEMRQAAFKTFASLSSNDEDIRKKIIETDNIMDQIISGLHDTSGYTVQLSAVRCLHSLSRSVQQLRTTFQDHIVWRPLMQLLQLYHKENYDKSKEKAELLTIASSTLCNLLLEFSPSKVAIIDFGGVELLCSLTVKEDPALRLNGVWALMNVSFQAEQHIKLQILKCLGTDQIFRLLTDSEILVLMKTLGLLRNLVSSKADIDRIMQDHSTHMMQAIILVLEDPDHTSDIKEQALCILANIADGDKSKDYILVNEDVLKKLMDYMMHVNIKLQIAAVHCVCNLIWREEPGSAERQILLKNFGFHRVLMQLRNSNDSILNDKVKITLSQFADT